MTQETPPGGDEAPYAATSSGEARRGALSSFAEFVRLGSFVILNVIAFLFIIRYLPAAEMGRYALVNVVVNLTLIIADLQMEKIAVRRIAQRDDVAEVIGSAFGVRMVGSLLATAATQLVFVGIGLLNGEVRGDVQLAALLASSQFFGDGFFVVGAVFQAELRAYLDAAPRILFVGLRFVLTLVLIKANVAWWALFLSWTGAYAVAGTVAIVMFRVKTGLALRPQVRGTGTLVREALSLGVAGLLGMATVQFGTIYLGITAAPETVAVFNAAILPIQYLSLFGGVVAIVAFPLVSRAWADRDIDRFGQIDSLARTAILTLFLPVVVILAVLPLDELLETVFGDGYGGAAAPLRLMSVALVLASLTVWAGFVFVAISKPRYIILVNGISLTVGAAACPFVVPRFGLPGLGAIGIAATGVGVVTASLLLRHDTPYSFDPRGSGRALGAGGALFAALTGLNRLTQNPILLCLGAAVIYPAMVLAFRVFPRTTLDELRAARPDRQQATALTADPSNADGDGSTSGRRPAQPALPSSTHHDPPTV